MCIDDIASVKLSVVLQTDTASGSYVSKAVAPELHRASALKLACGGVLKIGSRALFDSISPGQ
jgi:hypothetical protein